MVLRFALSIAVLATLTCPLLASETSTTVDPSLADAVVETTDLGTSPAPRHIDPDNQCGGSSGSVPHGLCMKCATKPGLLGLGRIAVCCVGNTCDRLQRDGWEISQRRYRDCSLDFSTPLFTRCTGGSC
ncbi:MAG: hypothetical protein AAGN66_00645 [Acidobacteriota bacterium]